MGIELSGIMDRKTAVSVAWQASFRYPGFSRLKVWDWSS
jgi:hypothetical protein